jgi:PBP1b-binding outer membrane lipoprotein LpoB
MKRAALFLLIAVSLTGCYSDQKRQVAVCKQYAEAKQTDTMSWDETYRNVPTCMAAAGYEANLDQPNCSHVFWETDAACYEPDNPMGRFIYRLGSRN